MAYQGLNGKNRDLPPPPAGERGGPDTPSVA